MSEAGDALRMLNVMPSWRQRLQQVADTHPAWQPFVDAWDELTTLYEAELKSPDGMAPRTYARMRQIRGIDV